MATSHCNLAAQRNPLSLGGKNRRHLIGRL
jgi:hypothetical protein